MTLKNILKSIKNTKLKNLAQKPTVEKIKYKMKSVGRLFHIVVLIPTLVSIIYFGVIASDVFISESKFVIRSPQKNQTSGLGSLLNTVGFNQSTDDSYIVSNFITSMDALKSVNKDIDLKKLYTSNDIDVFNRFASFYWNESFERLLIYFRKHIEITNDTQSSILTLTTRSYDPVSAQKINELLLMSSDRLINQLNEQSRLDLIKFSSFEVDEAKKNLEKADIELTKFRTNKSSEDIQNFIPKFQALTLERETAEKQLSTALGALEQARIDAQRKRLYLERIVEPSIPDAALEPKRIRGMLSTVIFCLVLWGVLKMLIAGIKEHTD